MKSRMLFNWNSSKLPRIFALAPPMITALGPGHVLRRSPRLQSKCPPPFQGPAAILNAAPRASARSCRARSALDPASDGFAVLKPNAGSICEHLTDQAAAADRPAVVWRVLNDGPRAASL